MTITNKFLKTIPSENSGANTSNAYDFQKDWSIWLLLECHQSMDDYMIIFDYHDDLVVFDSASNARTADFYQVKTKDKLCWNLSDLVRKKENSYSIVGKIYSNKLKFNCGVNSHNLISNARFKLTIDGGQSGEVKDCICAVELTDADKLKLRKCIQTEHKVYDIEFEKNFFFKVTDIGLRNHSDEILAKLTRFLEKRFPDKKSKPVPLYNALFADVSKKTDYGKIVSEYCDSLKRKSITKNEFESQLNSIAIKRDFTELWITIEPLLVSEGFNPIQTRNLRDNWDALEMHLMDSTNLILLNVFKFAKMEAKRIRNIGASITSLKEMMAEICKSINSTYPQLPVMFNKEYIGCIILAAFYE